MSPIDGRPILTAAAMREAESQSIAVGATVEHLMAKAGAGVAEAVRRLAAGSPVLVLSGPGNNGGDGYVAARVLAEHGMSVRVAALGEPGTDAARAARAGWSGTVAALADTRPAPVLVDALFGTGLSRGLEAGAAEAFCRLADAARLSIAIDLPSGVQTDTGQCLSAVPVFAVTLALGAVKPAHLLQPAASRCGAVRIVEIGVPVASDAHALARPTLPQPDAQSYKYSRGMVAVVAGAMRGASLLAAEAAMRSGAGYVALLDGDGGGPAALVHRDLAAGIGDRRIGAVLIGPGLGRDAAAQARLDTVLGHDHPTVFDGDALILLARHGPERLRGRTGTILTPHEGEFRALFGDGPGSKLDRARAAADRAQAVVVYKGGDTVIAAPGGAAVLAGDASPWLSTAGSGDTLAGTVAAQCAAGMPALAAAAAAVWLNGEAARRLGPAFIADDLARALTAARAGVSPYFGDDRSA